MSPQVSVLIATHNDASYIEATIRSILDQSFQDFEIVVTDDASSEGTPDVVRGISDRRVALDVLGTKRGAVVALNFGIRRSTGIFICILGARDLFLPDKLAKQIDYLNANSNTAAVFGLPRLIDDQGRPLGVGYREFTFPFSEPNPSCRQWLRHFFFNGNCLCPSTIMIRRSAYDNIGLFDPRLASMQDFDMWVRLCMIHEIHVMQDELSTFRILDNYRDIGTQRQEARNRRAFEYFHILKHYRKLPLALARQIFADDLRTNQIDSHRPYGAWLAELALLAQAGIPHRLFALETMFEAVENIESEFNRLIELGGKIDPFNMFAVGQVNELRQRRTSPSSIV